MKLIFENKFPKAYHDIFVLKCLPPKDYEDGAVEDDCPIYVVSARMIDKKKTHKLNWEYVTEILEDYILTFVTFIILLYHATTTFKRGLWHIMR